MERRNSLIALTVLVALPALNACGPPAVARASSPADSRGKVELTVYNDDFSMVREVRRVTLSGGRARVKIAEVSRELDPSSVLFSWPGTASAQVVGSTYDLGVGDSAGLLSRYLGKEVEMVWHGEDGREGKRIKGTLEVADGAHTVLSSDGKLLVDAKGTVVAPDTPDVVTIPQLSVVVQSDAVESADLQVAYLTRGLAWSADYVASLAAGSNDMTLECWATVTNRTGTTYPEAAVTLMAGAPNRAAKIGGELEGRGVLHMPNLPARNERRYRMNQVTEPSATGELYSYEVKSPATIAPDQMNRLRMIVSPKVTVSRDYSVRLPALGWYWEWGRAGTHQRRNAQLAIQFRNSTESGLGLPLPQGGVRVYEPDGESLRYVGAAWIGNTPKGETLSLTLSNVFDVTCEYRRLKAQRLDRRRVRHDVEAIVRNQKSRTVPVRLVADLGAGAKVVEESLTGSKLDASTWQWKVDVPAGGEKKLRFSVVVSG